MCNVTIKMIFESYKHGVNYKIERGSSMHIRPNSKLKSASPETLLRLVNTGTLESEAPGCRDAVVSAWLGGRYATSAKRPVRETPWVEVIPGGRSEIDTEAQSLFAAQRATSHELQVWEAVVFATLGIGGVLGIGTAFWVINRMAL
jgi:hypothetical protein